MTGRGMFCLSGAISRRHIFAREDTRDDLKEEYEEGVGYVSVSAGHDKAATYGGFYPDRIDGGDRHHQRLSRFGHPAV